MECKIASFNLNRFGADSRKDFNTIAKIIAEEHLDVVALQEIYSEGRGVERLLEQCVNRELYRWDFCPDFPPETSHPKKRSDMVSGNKCSEGYAYLWNTKRFRLLEYTKMGNTEAFQPHIINSREVNADCSFLARTPYYMRLQPLRGGFWELRLINIHIYHGGNDTQENINLRKEDVQILTVQKQLTTLRQEDVNANNFDHFTYSPALSKFVKVSYETIDAVQKYCGGDFAYYRKNISDHLPIVMTVKI